MLYLGFIGFADDYERSPEKFQGIRGWQKLAAQALLAIFVFLYLSTPPIIPGSGTGSIFRFSNPAVVVDMGILTVAFFAVGSWAPPMR